MKIYKATLLLLFISCLSYGQEINLNDLSQKVPVDPNVAIGKLENGLTYYIRHNPKSENKAELRLTINAGSILETDKQQGLAHFLEHMAFNGTTNFEKNELIDYLQNLGVQFGADLNAHTSFDETVYKLTLPTDDEKIFDQGMQILRDWGDGITLADEDIDEERGVVAEELRSGLVASRRLFNSYVPLITNEAHYADRLPIGKLDVIMNADYNEIRDFYKDWYRPELMAVVVVGDVDIEETKAKIVENFGSMENPANPKERKEFSIPGNQNLKSGVFTDEEIGDINFYAYYKKDKEKIETLEDYREFLLQRLFSGMLNQRMRELLESGEAPFLGAGVGIGNFLADKNTYFVSVSLKEDAIQEGIAAALKESERAKKFGFTHNELERYKRNLLNNANVKRKEEGKINSRVYVEDYIDHYMDGSPIPSSQFTYEFYKQQLPTITLKEVREVGKKWVRDDNITLVLTGPKKEGIALPSSKELEDWFYNAQKEELQPYVDDLKVTELMEKKPEPGKISDSRYIESINVTELELSNGIKVILKPTTLQSDIINLKGYRPGGSSLAPDSDYVSARSAGHIISQSGINGISNSGVRKLNMGKTVSVDPGINFYDELISGSSSGRDLETMLQMTHLFFTKPNKDEDLFQAYKANQVANAKNPNLNPFRYFYKQIAVEMSNNHLRAVPLTEEQVSNELDLNKAYNFYKERFANADGFTFIFVGSFEVEEIKPLIKTYLASLPSVPAEHASKDIGLRYTQGNNKVYRKGKEEKADVHIRYNGAAEFSVKEKKVIRALASLVKLNLYDELREKRGGVYGVRVGGFATDVPYEWYRLSIEFSSAPENVDDLVAAIHKEINKIKEEGVAEEDLNKVKEAIRLNAKEGLDYNSYWISRLKESYEYDLEPEKILDYNGFADELTAKKLQDAANKYLKKENYSQFILLPEDEG